MPELTGLHHISLMSADIRKNIDFYTQTLGMRLVKRTVNQDNPTSYHLFYGDETGSPGTEITWFDIPHLAQTHLGSGLINTLELRVSNRSALDYWAARLSEEGVSHSGITERNGIERIDFVDPEDLMLALVVDNNTAGGTPWDKSPVPVEHGIKGMNSVVLQVQSLKMVATVLKHVLNMNEAGTIEGDSGEPLHVFTMGDGGPGTYVYVQETPDAPMARPGRGSVHHIAYGSTMEDHDYWLDRIRGAGLNPSPIIDRYYFRSIYFREPNGILFEIATNGPGFAVDEDPEHLGETLALPPFLEHQRAAIERAVTPLPTPEELLRA